MRDSLINRIILFCLKNKLIVSLLVIIIVFWGIIIAPFGWNIDPLPSDPVPVDAIPDIGENQQIVFTKWDGRSPKDVEEQVSYPLTVSLLGIPGVKTVRSYSMFGFSSIYVIFKEGIDFYWSRTRIIEKLNSLPVNTLPEGVRAKLGPDSTALGQVFWYYIEGQDKNGKTTGGWDLNEIRKVQDWLIKYALLSVEGISEVASIGGFVQEYQIELDPDVLRSKGVSIEEIYSSVKNSNLDIGARTLEINKVEYLIRGVGVIKSNVDLENTIVKVINGVPILLKHIGKITLGPALRRGALDKDGSEIVGGVVVVRYGENPLNAIKRLKNKIKEISTGLPKKKLENGEVSQLKIIPFYDRSELIMETLGTLKNALTEEILITIIIVILMLFNLRSSILISGLLPFAVLIAFIAMKYFKVDANIVALSGIAIAIGTMVDMGIVVVENIIKHIDKDSGDGNTIKTVFNGVKEVSTAVITAIATTIVSFLPVFFMEAAEGKLFKPLAFTKTFALLGSVAVALFIIPAFAHFLFFRKKGNLKVKKMFSFLQILTGILLILLYKWWIGAILIIYVLFNVFKDKIWPVIQKKSSIIINIFIIVFVMFFLTKHWLPLGPEKGILLNFIFITVILGSVLLLFYFFYINYEKILRWNLKNRKLFYAAVLLIIFFGVISWMGAGIFFGWLPGSVKDFRPVKYLLKKFPGMGKEFMPSLDEGAFLYMPTTMPHASIGEALDILKKQDMAFKMIPEIKTAVGKIGRAETPLDPAPVSMIETIINYRPKYILDDAGIRMRFKYDPADIDYFRDQHGNELSAADGKTYKVKGKYIRDKNNQLIEDNSGYPFRLWRSALDPDINPDRKEWNGINTRDDIWQEILKAGKIPGSTSAPKLQPIETRIVMLQSGMRAPMGLKIKGPDLESIEKTGLSIEKLLKEVDLIEPDSVSADRIVGKPYLEIILDREKMARYGIKVQTVQRTIELAIGSKPITKIINGRERYAVSIRYKRELRNDIQSIKKLLVTTQTKGFIPLGQITDLKYRKGPQVIKSEDTFLIGYVLFDKKKGNAEVDVIKKAEDHLKYSIKEGKLNIPAGVSYSFAGSFENQVRSEKKLLVILPLSLIIIFLILYFQFKRISTTILVFFGIAVAWSGGFFMIWIYSQTWFLNFSVFGVNMQELFGVHPMNLSVAVWVGFLALFGIASDDGVLIATYLDDKFEKEKPDTVEKIREATVKSGLKRIRPAIMTSATTIIALIPVLTSTGRGSDIMKPMAIPTFGGMIFAVFTLFVVPVSYSLIQEIRLKGPED